MKSVALLLCLGAVAFAANIRHPLIRDFKRPGNRIIQGNEVEKGMLPWQAALSIANSEGKTFKCGGSLISPNHVLTAAHCLVDATAVEVWFGVNDYSADPEVSREVDKFVSHPEFDVETYHNDVALLYFAEPVEESYFVKIIALPKKGDVIKENEGFYASGFGLTEDGDNDKLYYIPLLSISNEECSEVYDNIDDGIVCCQGHDLQAICNGDSGGPLISWSQENEITLAGVVSFGPKDSCTTGKPNGYTRVEHYLDWIEENMKTEEL